MKLKGSIMQVRAVSAYSYSPVKPRQQVDFRANRMVSVDELLKLTKDAGVNIKPTGEKGLPKGVGAIMLEIQQKLNATPLGALANLQKKPHAEAKLAQEVRQQILEKAAQYDIGIQHKTIVDIAHEVAEVERIHVKAIACKYSLRGQTIAELRAEMAEVDNTYKLAQSHGIKIEGLDFQTVLYKLQSIRIKTPPPAGNPFRQSGAKNAPIINLPKVVSLRELLERGPKTKYEAIVALNYLGAGITAKSSGEEILSVTSLFMRKFHPQKTGGDDANMKLVSAAKSLLVQSSTGLYE
jgi:hypothetical protein